MNSFQTLALPGADGDPVQVFLDRRHLIPVPLYFWKLVHDHEADKVSVS
jgi:hypothetical protein